MHKKAVRGFSAISVAIAVLVSVVLLMGSMSAFVYIDHAKISNDVQLMGNLKQNTQRYAQAVGAFTAQNTTVQILHQLGFFNFPSLNTTINNNIVTVRHQWGGAVTVAHQQVVQPGDGIRYSFSNVPSNICVDLGSRLDSLVTWIQVGDAGTFVKGIGGNTNLETLQTECFRPVNRRVMMRFTFLR